ncbi:hypothetical protein DVH05_009480 [Phytophthora capsici]|nr:hypothetical protein DVH05_009480 [Phytophthora capsici]
MDEFRRGIEQSPLMERNELIREVLLMEYRIGNLEIDKTQLQTLRDLQMGVGSNLAGEQGNNDDISTERLDISNGRFHLDVPAQVSDCVSSHVHLPEIKSSKASNGRGGFFEELREHLYPSKSHSNRGKRHEFAASPVAFHKPWGLHLNNTSLPYIRLKKKNPVPLYVEPTTSGSLAARMSRIPSTTSLAEPYLKSLKNRHKQRGKKNKNTIK